MSILDQANNKINGFEAEVTVQEYTTKNPEEIEWESHKFHLDVQYLIWGVERIGYAPIDGMKPIKEYNVASDKLIWMVQTATSSPLKKISLWLCSPKMLISLV